MTKQLRWIQVNVGIFADVIIHVEMFADFEQFLCGGKLIRVGSAAVAVESGAVAIFVQTWP
jgi:hypothetical protein